MSLYDEIGAECIEKAIREFYSRAVIDPIIGYFFFNVEIETLIAKQIDFTSRLFGFKGSETVKTRSLKSVHHPLHIRGPHFARRQVLMSEVLRDLGLDERQRKEWLKLEAQLKPLIMKSST
jgi:truncated hemoglobin YjbI